MSETRPDLENIRVQEAYSYIDNLPGESLKSVMTTIDSMLRESSPDMMAPGLLNWIHKDLFLYRWKNFLGSEALVDAHVSYYGFGESKIARGRYEIKGNGKVYYDRLVAVSDVRGVTGRIFFGANAPGAIVTAGVECFDSEQTYLGNNGGFIANQLEAPVGSWQFSKSSCFSEGEGDLRKLLPGTRFVKLFIEVAGNTDRIYFDESELTVFEVDERYLLTSSSIIDWNLAEFFEYKTTEDTVFTFLNISDGKVKTISVQNNGVNPIHLNFPAGIKWQGGEIGYDEVITSQGNTSAFSFITMGGVIYGSVIEEMA